MSKGSRSVVVIGGGVAGLVAAYRLERAGISALVLEADAVPGGRVQSVRRNGYIFDTGADALTEGYIEYLALLDEVGLKGQLVSLPSVVGTVRNGRVIYLDATSTWSTLKSPILSLGAKLRFYRGLKKVAAMAGGMKVAHMHSLSGIDDTKERAKDLSEQMFGKEASDYVVDPLLRMLGGTGLEDSSWLEVVSGVGFISHAAYCLAGGQAALPLALAAKLKVRYRCRARSVVERGDKVEVGFDDEQGQSQTVSADGCVLATMYEAGVELYAPFAELTADYRQKLTHMKLGKVQLGYRVPTRTDAYAIQVPTLEDPDVMLVFLDHNKCKDRAPRGHSVISVFSETRAAEKLLNRSDEELTRWARSYAERWFPELQGHFDISQVNRWPVMAPAITPGYYQRAADVLARLPERSRVQIACDMFTKSSQEAATSWGTRAAKNLVAVLS